MVAELRCMYSRPISHHSETSDWMLHSEILIDAGLKRPNLDDVTKGCFMSYFDQKLSLYFFWLVFITANQYSENTSFSTAEYLLLLSRVMNSSTIYHCPALSRLSPPLPPVFSFSSFLITGSGELSEGAWQLQQPSINRGHSHCSDQAAASTQQGMQPLSTHVSPQQSASTLFHYCWILIQTPASHLVCRFIFFYLTCSY